MKIQITADSTIDLTEELKQKYDIKTIGLTVALGDQEFTDGVDITADEIFEFVGKTGMLPKTGAVSVEGYKEFFSKVATDDTAVIHFSISNEMSSSHGFAKKASEIFKNVYVVDSRCLSTGTALLAIYARRLADDGASLEDILKAIKDKTKRDAVECSFILDNLKLLHKGGRCSAVQMFGANLLGLKICIGVHEGKMGVDAKYRRKFEKAVGEYIRDTLQKYPSYDDYCCFITYTSVSPAVLESAKAEVERSGVFRNVYITRAGATIASHCGENTIGLLYLKN